MTMNWRVHKAKARADIHRNFAVPAVYITHAAGNPIRCNVRVHLKVDLNANDFVWPNSPGYFDMKPAIIFDKTEVPKPLNDSLVVVSSEEIYRIGVSEPFREGFAKTEMSELDIDERAAFVESLGDTSVNSAWDGILTYTGEVTLTASGVVSLTELGSPILVSDSVSLVAIGVESTTEIGTSVLSINETQLVATGVESATELGVSDLTINEVSLTATGVESVTEIGTPELTINEVVLTAEGVESQTEIGTPSLISGGVLLSGESVESATELGTPELVSGSVQLVGTSVESATELGVPDLTTGGNVWEFDGATIVKMPSNLNWEFDGSVITSIPEAA